MGPLAQSSELGAHIQSARKAELDNYGADRLEKFVLALQLMGFDLGGQGRRLAFSEPRWFTHFPQSGQIVLPRFSGEVRPMSTPELLDAIVLAAHIEENSHTKIERAALGRFRKALATSTHEDQIVDSVIALEGALLPTARNELRYRFAINGSLLLAADA